MDIFPLKNRIYARLYGKLVSGACKESALPPEQEFAKALGVSRNTLRAALEMLENDGVLLRTRAVGTFPAVEKSKNFAGTFLYCMHDKRPSPHVGDTIFRGITAAAAAVGGRADFCSVEHLKKIPLDELIAILRESGCRGVILHSRNFVGGEDIATILKNTGLPVVLAYCEKGDAAVTGFAAIRHCGRESWLAALRYLVDTGHRRIVTLSNDKELVRECFLPEEYDELLRGMGLEIRHNPVLRCAMNDKEIYEKLAPLFRGENMPDAILSYSDYWALPVYRVLKKLKKRIPQEISVMGYCGSVDSSFMSPELTTISIGYEEIGWMGVRMLTDSASWFNVPDRTPPEFVTPFMLKVRESTLLR